MLGLCLFELFCGFHLLLLLLASAANIFRPKNSAWTHENSTALDFLGQATAKTEKLCPDWFIQLESKGRGGSSSGSASDYGSRGPGFDSRCHWELGFFLSLLFLFSFLSFNQWCILDQVPRGGATLLIFNFPRK